MGTNKKKLSLFSEETLDSIAMAQVYGGEGDINQNCPNCSNCVAGCACAETNIYIPGYGCIIPK